MSKRGEHSRKEREEGMREWGQAEVNCLNVGLSCGVCTANLRHFGSISLFSRAMFYFHKKTCQAD